MIANRSVTTDIVLPHVAYRDVADAHYDKAKAADATITEDLHETIYGERQYGVRDLDGHFWLFSMHAHDVSPTDWGAAITNPTT
jgi:uncharacterized glyoxalase superfamily protein PhnB